MRPWLHILEPLQRLHFLDQHFKGTFTTFCVHQKKVYGGTKPDHNK